MNVEETIDQAAHLLQTGKAPRAAQVLKRVLQNAPDHAHGHHLYGLALFQNSQLQGASQAVRKAVTLDPGNPIFLNNLGLICIALGHSEKALDAHTQAIRVEPQNPTSYFHRANVYKHMGQTEEAIADYETVLQLDPYSVEAMNNLGSVLVSKLEFERARQLYDDALSIRVDFAFAWNNLALLQQQTDSLEAAEKSLRNAIQYAPDYLEAHVNLGTLLMRSNRYEAAAEVFQDVLRLNPKQPFILGNLAYCKSMLCDWQQYRQLWGRIEAQIRRDELPCSPIIFLNGSDDVALAKKLASAYTKRMVPALATEKLTRTTRTSSKLRIGYFSADYREHPVATLIVGVLEQHDRDRFEVIGYALNKEDGSPMRKRMQTAFDTFHDISEMALEETLEMVRQHELDIAVDLNGYTEGSRPALFKAQVAPIQVSYLGFPGTSGSDHFDYTIADERIITADRQKHYAEKLLFMPDCFQPNDDSRVLSDDVLTRAQFDLPENAVVFCCFNKLYKLNPEVFASWMKILKQVPQSVLWLYTEDALARQNLCREAVKAGVESERLIFAQRTPKYEHHLARYRLADLFLDTFPYTAHTTASDAMWAGLPVLTRSGESLASRVGESLLYTLGMPELITYSVHEFVTKAVALAQSPDELQKLKTTLNEAKKSSSLYNTRQYARWLERGYEQIAERKRENLPAENIWIARDASA